MVRRAKKSKVEPERWAARVLERSPALELEKGLFKRAPRTIARGLKRSAAQRSKHSTARSDYQAAMSMLTFFINRAGRKLTAEDRARLEAAKAELRRVYGRQATNG